MSEQKLREEINKLLKKNTVKGYSKHLQKDFVYIKPSSKKYPFQWWWDTFFHSYILCALRDYDSAKQNLQSLFAMQQENGFVGHMIYWQRLLPKEIFNIIEAKPSFDQLRPHMSQLIQPSFAAQVVKKIYEGTKDVNFLKEMLPKLKNYHNWLAQERVFDSDDLISIISPMESGMDWKASFDPLLNFNNGKANSTLYNKVVWLETKNFGDGYDIKKIRQSGRFIVKEVGMNTITALDLKALSELCVIAGEKDSAVYYRERAQKIGNSIMDLCFDKKTMAFYDINRSNGQQIKILTATIFFPMVLPEVQRQIAQQIIEKHLLNKDEFWLKYPIPSVAKNEPQFFPNESRFIWRGSTWVMLNWFLFRCLANKEFTQEAKIMRKTVNDLIAKSGFREYYNPFTGEGYGAKNFTWSGLILDMHDEI